MMQSGEDSSLNVTTAQTDTDVRRRVAVSRHEIAQAEMAALRRELIAVRGEKERFQASMKDYLLNHKMAVAAIAAGVGGTGVVLDDKNEFSGDIKAVAGTVAVLGALWAIANYDEVVEVADRLMEASATIEDFTTRTSTLKHRLAAAESRLASSETFP